MQKVQFNGIRIKSEDPDATADWYMENFGIGLNTPGYDQGWEIIDPNEKDAGPVSHVDKTHPEFNGHQNDVTMSLMVSDLDQLLEDLKSQGIEAVTPVKDYEYGRYTYIKDLDGYLVELYEPNDSANNEMSNPRRDS